MKFTFLKLQRSVFHFLFFAFNITAWADGEIRLQDSLEVGLEGNSSQRFHLSFSSGVMKLMEKMRGWESHLRAQGVDAEIFVGAGEIRRAFLGMKDEGPGDVEIFVHLRGRNIFPEDSLPQFEALFRQHGVDFRQEIHAIFGEKKKLDLFFKDQTSMDRGLDYVGNIGRFAGMGDTTLNKVLFSPVRRMLSTDPESAKGLVERRISLTELEKTAPLEMEAKVAKTQCLSGFREALLRMQMRSLRLWVDLRISSNPNNLRLDQTFDSALRGFELFFAKCSDADIAMFEMEFTHIEQFYKIFRQRSSVEMKKLRELLKNEFQPTLEVWRKLNLDFELLWQSDDEALLPRSQRELLAVKSHASLAEIKNEITPTGKLKKITNPGREMSQFMQANLSRIDAHLATFFEVYSDLGVEQRLEARKLERTLRKHFAGVANKRLGKSQTSFLDDYGRQFPGIAAVLAELSDDDYRTASLEDVLRKYFAGEAKYRALAMAQLSAHRAETLEQLRANVLAVRAEGNVPSIMLDLDDTFFPFGNRMALMLKIYDDSVERKIFANVDVSGMMETERKEYLFRILQDVRPKLSAHERLKIVEEIEVLYELRNHDLYNEDSADPQVRAVVEEMRSLGAEVNILTARREFGRSSTVKSLKRSTLQYDELLMGPNWGSAAGKIKVGGIEYYRKRHASRRRVVVAALDDKRGVLGALESAYPGEFLTIQAIRMGREVYFVTDPAVILNRPEAARKSAKKSKSVAAPCDDPLKKKTRAKKAA